MCTFTLEIIRVSGCYSVNISSVFKNKFIRTICWTLGRKLTQNKKLAVFNEVQLICSFFPGALNNIFVLIFFFQFVIKTRKCSNCLRKFFIFLQRQSCPPFVCHFFYLSVHFISKWVQRDKFLFTMWFHNFPT